MRESFDVVILGCGEAGIFAAYELEKLNPGLKLLDFTGTDGEFEVSDEDINIGISVQKGNSELLDAINGVLATLSEDDYTNMMNEAISVQPLSE